MNVYKYLFTNACVFRPSRFIQYFDLVLSKDTIIITIV